MRLVVASTGTLPRVAHLTDNFTSEAPLSPAVLEAISIAFEQGWADPKKLSQASGRAAILADSAKSQLAEKIGVRPEKLEVIGEPSLTHYIALAGFLRPNSTFICTTVDVGKIRAVARSHPGEVLEVGVDHHGALIREGLKITAQSLFSLQAVNGETGVAQELDRWRGGPGRVVVDGTKSLLGFDHIDGFAAATFDAQSWAGPAGIGFIAINDEKNFRYPLPHIAPIRVPGSYSLPLLIGSAVALEELEASRTRLISLRNLLAKKLSNVAGVSIVGMESAHSSNHLSIVVDGLSAEELLRALLPKNISVDAGSACSPEDLTPSHVIASMGYPTAGHIRISVHLSHGEHEIDNLVKVLDETLVELRS
jgi:cysteine desulfurase